jgi:hypothetical protein
MAARRRSARIAASTRVSIQPLLTMAAVIATPPLVHNR